MRVKTGLILSLLFVLVVGRASTLLIPKTDTFESQFQSLAAPFAFNFATWEIKTLALEIKDKRITPPSSASLSAKNVLHYFSYVALAQKLQDDLKSIQAGQSAADSHEIQTELNQIEDQKKSLRPIAEATISEQVTQVLAEEGIYSPWINSLQISFPPVNFSLEKPLYVLVVSPRDKISRIEDVTLTPNITPSQKDALESEVDGLNVSSLVIQIGGLGATFPSFVDDQGDLKWTLETVAHEWLHQYLAFKPLGVRYVSDLLGITSLADIDTLNETLANIAGKEIGDRVYAEYYASSEPAASAAPAAGPPPDFDFNAAMRDIRRQVDDYLARGQVQAAEKYMQDQRQFLASNGYNIRKLNQAYFAFYGSYADAPSSIDPIGNELKSLRLQSPTLKGFLDQASGLTSKADLEKILKP
jgi:hypothetical protein